MRNSLFLTVDGLLKFSSANFQKNDKSKLYHVEYSRLEGKQFDLDGVAHDKPSHPDLRCLQIQLFSSLVLEELKKYA